MWAQPAPGADEHWLQSLGRRRCDLCHFHEAREGFLETLLRDAVRDLRRSRTVAFSRDLDAGEIRTCSTDPMGNHVYRPPKPVPKPANAQGRFPSSAPSWSEPRQPKNPPLRSRSQTKVHTRRRPMQGRRPLSVAVRLCYSPTLSRSIPRPVPIRTRSTTPFCPRTRVSGSSP